MSNEKTLQVYEESALGQLAKEEIRAAVELLKVTLPGGKKMNEGQLGAVAMHSVLTNTLPGTDTHYAVTSDGKLLKIDDYKLLVRWANEREQLKSGDPSDTIKDSYHTLNAEEKQKEGLGPKDHAVFCTILSNRDKQDIREWIDIGFTPQEALDLVGDRAIGVVKDSDKKIPVGWSPLQKARKLALKNAIRLRYGQPSREEILAMRDKWAKIAGPEDWQEVPADLPLEAQARLADLTVISREAQEKAAKRTPEERREAIEKRTNIMRGEVEEVGIGDDYPKGHIHPDYDQLTKDEPEEKKPTDDEQVEIEIEAENWKALRFSEFCGHLISGGHYKNEAQIETALSALGIEYDPAQNPEIQAALVEYAKSLAEELPF